jgi:hypothetical protein
MEGKGLTGYCFETLSKELPLQRVSGLDELENVKLLSGQDGGGIKIYQGDKIDKVTLVDFNFGDGIPIPHHGNALSVGSELFQILPDLTYKMPIWGINSIVMKDGTYYFDTDFTFGFDLVMEYDFTMNYLDPFNEVYKKFWNHKDFKRVYLDETTTWVRTYISPVFVMVATRVETIATVYELCAELIRCWLTMYKDAEKRDEAFKQSQLTRIKAQYAGMQQTDRMGKVIMNAYGQETFSKFFKAML